MAVDVKSDLATEIVAMILDGARQYQEMTRSVGQRVKTPELVMMSVAAMSNSPSATARLLEYGLSPTEADRILDQARRAGRELAESQGFTEIVERLYD